MPWHTAGKSRAVAETGQSAGLTLSWLRCRAESAAAGPDRDTIAAPTAADCVGVCVF